MKRIFYAVIEVEDEAWDGETWDGDKYDVAAWIDHGMGSSSKFEAEATVWDNLADFTADNILETLAELGETSD